MLDMKKRIAEFHQEEEDEQEELRLLGSANKTDYAIGLTCAALLVALLTLIAMGVI